MEHPRPDDKDWTWVLERPCPQCGFDVTAIGRDKLGARLRANAASWRTVLNRGDAVAVRPPAPADQGPVWSALEYGCHVRDVYTVLGDRIRRMLADDGPTFTNWDQDQAAVEHHYAEQDPGRVGYDLAVAAGRVADMVDRVNDRQWARTGTRSDGATFTVESLTLYLLHDVAHHLWDVEVGFDAIAAAAS